MNQWVEIKTDDGLLEKHVVEVLELFGGKKVFIEPYSRETLDIDHPTVSRWGPMIPSWES